MGQSSQSPAQKDLISYFIFQQARGSTCPPFYCFFQISIEFHSSLDTLPKKQQ